MTLPTDDGHSDALPPLIPMDDAVERPPTVSSRSGRRTVTIDRDTAWSAVLVTVFMASLVLALLGFLEPWISVDRGLASAPSFSVDSVPVVSELGVFWVVVLIVLAVIAWLTRQRWLLVVGAMATFATAFVLLVLAILFGVVPHLLPFWLIPRGARSYVPDLASGSGPVFALVSCLLLLVWFVMAAFVRPVTHRSDGGSLHRMEQRVENLWARIDSRGHVRSGDLPPLT